VSQQALISSARAWLPALALDRTTVYADAADPEGVLAGGAWQRVFPQGGGHRPPTNKRFEPLRGAWGVEVVTQRAGLPPVDWTVAVDRGTAAKQAADNPPGSDRCLATGAPGRSCPRIPGNSSRMGRSPSETLCTLRQWAGRRGSWCWGRRAYRTVGNWAQALAPARRPAPYQPAWANGVRSACQALGGRRVVVCPGACCPRKPIGRCGGAQQKRRLAGVENGCEGALVQRRAGVIERIGFTACSAPSAARRGLDGFGLEVLAIAHRADDRKLDAHG